MSIGKKWTLVFSEQWVMPHTYVSLSSPSLVDQKNWKKREPFRQPLSLDKLLHPGFQVRLLGMADFSQCSFPFSKKRPYNTTKWQTRLFLKTGEVGKRVRDITWSIGSKQLAVDTVISMDPCAGTWGNKIFKYAGSRGYSAVFYLILECLTASTMCWKLSKIVFAM